MGIQFWIKQQSSMISSFGTSEVSFLSFLLAIAAAGEVSTVTTANITATLTGLV